MINRLEQVIPMSLSTVTCPLCRLELPALHQAPLIPMSLSHCGSDMTPWSPLRHTPSILPLDRLRPRIAFASHLLARLRATFSAIPRRDSGDKLLVSTLLPPETADTASEDAAVVAVVLGGGGGIVPCRGVRFPASVQFGAIDMARFSTTVAFDTRRG